MSERLSTREWIYGTTYRATSRLRHHLGLHNPPRGFSAAPRCDWCGHRSAEQQEIARRNWEAANNPARAWSAEAKAEVRAAGGDSDE